MRRSCTSWTRVCLSTPVTRIPFVSTTSRMAFASRTVASLRIWRPAPLMASGAMWMATCGRPRDGEAKATTACMFLRPTARSSGKFIFQKPAPISVSAEARRIAYSWPQANRSIRFTSAHKARKRHDEKASLCHHADSNGWHSLASAFFGREAEESLKTNLLAFSFLGITGALFAFSQSIEAQVPAGPVAAPPPGTAPATKAPEPAPLPPPRQSILGAWKLNKDESDDPRQQMQNSRDSNGGGSGRRGGGGWPGGGGPYGGRRGGMGG